MSSCGNPHLIVVGLELEDIFRGRAIGLHIHVVPAIRSLDEASSCVANPVVAAVVDSHGERLNCSTRIVNGMYLLEVPVVLRNIVSVDNEEAVAVSTKLLLLSDVFSVEIAPMAAVEHKKGVAIVLTIMVE